MQYEIMNVRKHFFADRVMKVGNSLPLAVDDFKSPSQYQL